MEGTRQAINAMAIVNLKQKNNFDFQERDPGVRFAACSGLPRQQWQIRDKQVSVRN